MPQEGKMLEYAFSLNYRELVISLIVLAAVGVAIYMLIKKIQDILGIETKAMRERRLMEQNISDLKMEMDTVKEEQERSKEARREFNQRMEDSQKEVMDAINKLSESLAKKEAEDNKRAIEDMRWIILDFANAISNKRQYSSEAYAHVMDVHTDYIRLLKEIGLENGRVDAAMSIIKEKYEQGMRDGFPI